MITTLTGTNHFLLQRELNDQTQKFVDEFGDISLEKLDGEEASSERLIEATQSLPFLAAKKLVVLKNPGNQKPFAEAVETIIQSVPETTDLIIVEHKIDKRSSYFKVLKSKTEYKEFTEPDSQKLNTWIVQYVKEQGGGISLGDASYLVERVGQNQQLLYQELDKLLTYDLQITRANIDLLTDLAPQSTIFELIDAAFAGSSKKTLEIYKQQRALKVEPQQIMAMLSWQLHVLAVVKVAGDQSPDEIARQAKMSPYVVRKTVGIANRISLAEIKELISRALALDVRFKSQAIDPDEALQHLLLTLSS